MSSKTSLRLEEPTPKTPHQSLLGKSSLGMFTNLSKDSRELRALSLMSLRSLRVEQPLVLDLTHMLVSPKILLQI